MKTNFILFFIFIFYIVISWQVYKEQTNTQTFFDDTNLVIQQSAIKKKLLEDMHTIARKRSSTLLEMYNSDDPFEVDDLQQQFNQYQHAQQSAEGEVTIDKKPKTKSSNVWANL